MSSYYTWVEDGKLKPHSDRCSKRSAYIMRSWAKSVQGDVFFKNTRTSKKWIVASVASTEQCQWRQAGLQTRGSSPAMIGACNTVTGTTSGLQQAGEDIFKRAPVVPQTLILQSFGERNRLHSRAHVFWLTHFILGHCAGPPSVRELEGHSWTVVLCLLS